VISGFSARRRQRRRARHLEKRLRELDRLDRVHGLGAMPVHRTGGRRDRRRALGRRPGPLFPSLLVAVLLVGALVAFSPGEPFGSVRRVVGLGPHRLGTPPRVPHGQGHFRFMRTQGGQPVGYDPCRAIKVEVNPQGAPADYQQLVDTAIAHTNAATGLRLERVGVTDDRNVSSGLSFAPVEPRPVLVMWATAAEVPDLAGDIAGIGGSAAAADRTGRMRYVTGRVVLDAASFDRFTAEEQPLAQAIVDHEFGHLVGLAHVDDPGELMYSHNVGRTTYGPGDREGLADLGGIPC
jgi:hypothetical protein